MIRLSLYYRLILGTFIVWGTIVILNSIGLWQVRNRQEQGLTAYRDRSAVAFRLAGLERSLADLRYHLIGDPASLQRYSRQALQLAADNADRMFAEVILSLRGEPLNRADERHSRRAWIPCQSFRPSGENSLVNHLRLALMVVGCVGRPGMPLPVTGLRQAVALTP